MPISPLGAIASPLNLHIDHTQGVGETVLEVAASAAAALPASAGSAAPAPISATTLASLSAAASPNASAPLRASAEEYVAPLGNNMLGVVAGFLPNEDHTTFCQLNLVVKVETDRQVQTLSLTANDATALFKDAANFSNVKRLSLIRCDAPGVAAFVDALSHGHFAPFELVLIEGLHGGVSADVLQRVSKLPLSALTLHPEYHFEPETVAGLASAAFPISLNLDNVWQTRNFSAVTQISSLTSLSMTANFPSVADASALGSHPSLSAFQGSRCSAEHLLAVLANPRLKTLSLDRIDAETDEVKAALGNHPSITALRLMSIGDAELLIAILRNPIICTLTLSPYSMHPSLMPLISEMPTLRTFTLAAGDARGLEVDGQTMQALRAKPLETLNFEGVWLNEAMLSIAVSAHATTLSLQHNAGTFDQAAIATLVGNPHVKSLSFAGEIVGGGAAQIAAAPGLEKLSLDFWSAKETVQSVQRAWETAGKSLADLTVVVH